MTYDVDAVRERIAAALAEPPTDTTPGDEPAPETVGQIAHRIFEGDDLPAIADRMFRH